jgi:two-component system, chemotaxis family, protein-glutamate methylesterase/glutaminase
MGRVIRPKRPTAGPISDYSICKKRDFVKEALKIMVVDDTVTYRMIMKKVAESIPGIVVTATASNGKLALDKLNNQVASKSSTIPDVILLDVEMPVMDGLTTLKQIQKQHPNITTIMVSALSRSNANIVLECLTAGALDFITKPLESNIDAAREALRHDLEPILSVIVRDNQTAKKAEALKKPASSEKQEPAPVREVIKKKPLPASRAFRTRPPMAAAPRAKPVAPVNIRAQANKATSAIAKPDLVLIGSSTGGPAALTKVLGGLSGALSVPVLIVQHMPPVFTASLAAQLTRTSGLVVKEAQDGMKLTPGSITIAMGGRHMALKNDNRSLHVSLNDGPKVNECRPAVDVLFMSVSTNFKGNTLAVILTGMGRDGANGVDALKRAGHTHCITQNKQSCVVYGMPRSVDEKNLSDQSLALDEIGPEISKICL